MPTTAKRTCTVKRAPRTGPSSCRWVARPQSAGGGGGGGGQAASRDQSGGAALSPGVVPFPLVAGAGCSARFAAHAPQPLPRVPSAQAWLGQECDGPAGRWGRRLAQPCCKHAGRGAPAVVLTPTPPVSSEPLVGPGPGSGSCDLRVSPSSAPTTQRCLSRRLSWHRITVMPST